MSNQGRSKQIDRTSDTHVGHYFNLPTIIGNTQEVAQQSSGTIGAETMQGSRAEGASSPSTASSATPATSSKDTEKRDDKYVKWGIDWFVPGRHLEVWAPEDREIHQKRFILLDTKNEAGTGVRVDVLDDVEALYRLDKESYSDLTNMVLTCCDSRKNEDMTTHEQRRNEFIHSDVQRDLLDKLKSKMDQVHMLKHGREDKLVMPGSFVRLAHTYNIPFHYWYEDLGRISHGALQDLRFGHIKWAANAWNLEERIGQHDWVE